MTRNQAQGKSGLTAELASDLRHFEDEGYLVVRGLLDPGGDIDR